MKHLYLHSQKRLDSVAQLVEQRPFKAWVLGSSPSRVTKKAFRKTEGFFIILSLDINLRYPRKGFV